MTITLVVRPGKASASLEVSWSFPMKGRLFLVGMVAMVGCSAAGPETWDRDLVVAGVAEAMLAPFDTAVMSFMQANDITGGTLAVTEDGQVLMERGYSYRPTEHHRLSFEVLSVESRRSARETTGVSAKQRDTTIQTSYRFTF